MMDKKEKNKLYLEQYFKSIVGVKKRLYHHMKERSKNNNWEFNISYSQFDEWLKTTRFNFLYYSWCRMDYNNKFKPSIDRIDENGIYEFSNMRVIEWGKNWKLGQLGNKNISSYTKSFSKYRKSRQYEFIVVDSENNVICVSSNQTKTAEKLNLNVSHLNSCLLNKRKSHKNYRFYVLGVVAL